MHDRVRSNSKGRRAFLGGVTAALAASPWLKRVHASPATVAPTLATPFRITPFVQPLPIPEVAQPVGIGKPPYRPGEVEGGIAPEYADLATYERFLTKYYQIEMKEAIHQFIPGVETPVWTYNGTVPGPTFMTRIGEPIVVRFINHLPVETSIHFHGGHTPAHADGNPVFLIHHGQARDYFYPNTVPMHNGELDYSESISSAWYHDHAMDITAHNVYMGLAGCYFSFDDLENNLIDTNVLPKAPFDLPLVFSDRMFNADGTLAYDMLDHDGQLGDVFLTNGVVQPVMRVQRRKYRFRMMGASNARFYNIRMSNGQKMLQIGNDSWLLPYAMERTSLLFSPAKRADVIIDFTNAPSILYLENTIEHNDGRGPSGTAKRPTKMVKFVVEGAPVRNDCTVTVNTPIRPHTPILASEIEATRTFDFERKNGAWVVNGEFWDPNRVDAAPRLGSAERWILRNNSGGWWHPIHIHLESHQIQTINGQKPSPWDAYKTDTTILPGNTEAEIFMKFRTFQGPFVFHCHNSEHEDMRMMCNFNVVPGNPPSSPPPGGGGGRRPPVTPQPPTRTLPSGGVGSDDDDDSSSGSSKGIRG